MGYTPREEKELARRAEVGKAKLWAQINAQRHQTPPQPTAAQKAARQARDVAAMKYARITPYRLAVPRTPYPIFRPIAKMQASNSTASVNLGRRNLTSTRDTVYLRGQISISGVLNVMVI